MLSWKDIYAQQEHCRDLQQEAEKERLISQVRATGEKARPLYRRATTWLRSRLPNPASVKNQSLSASR